MKMQYPKKFNMSSPRKKLSSDEQHYSASEQWGHFLPTIKKNSLCDHWGRDTTNGLNSAKSSETPPIKADCEDS